MEGLFIVEGTRILPSPELLLIDEFRYIWENYEKELAIDIIAYAYFMVSQSSRNIFIGYKEELRSEKILSHLPSGVEINILMTEEKLNINPLIDTLDEFQQKASPSLRFYEASMHGAEKMISFFNSFDFGARTNQGNAVYKPADITRALKETAEVLKTLQGLRDKVRQELLESSRATKQRRVNPFER
jgi:hypothetical protein